MDESEFFPRSKPSTSIKNIRCISQNRSFREAFHRNTWALECHVHTFSGHVSPVRLFVEPLHCFHDFRNYLLHVIRASEVRYGSWCPPWVNSIDCHRNTIFFAFFSNGDCQLVDACLGKTVCKVCAKRVVYAHVSKELSDGKGRLLPVIDPMLDEILIIFPLLFSRAGKKCLLARKGPLVVSAFISEKIKKRLCLRRP